MLKKPQSPPLTLILETDPKSVAAEAYRSLRTNLQFSKLDQGSRKLLITSATPGEGKTTTVANLGLAMAQAGGRICLIDSDLRQPSLHDLFGVSNGIGLTVALAEAKSVDQVIVPTTDAESLPGAKWSPSTQSLGASGLQSDARVCRDSRRPVRHLALRFGAGYVRG